MERTAIIVRSRAIRTGVLTALLISGLSIQANASDDKAQSKAKTEAAATTEATPPKVLTRPSETSKKVQKTVFETVLEEILDRFKRTPSFATTRGNVCPIAPGILEALPENSLAVSPFIYSDRPLFVWQGDVSQIEIEDYDTGVLLQTGNISPGQTTWQYSGPPLQPGTAYLWRLKSGPDSVMRAKEFTVMPRDMRAQIQQTLASTSSRNLGETTPLDMADYFAQQHLWSDTLTALYSAPDQTNTVILNRKIEDLGQQLCQRTPDLSLGDALETPMQ